jgi:CYTH domain-containing protein
VADDGGVAAESGGAAAYEIERKFLLLGEPDLDALRDAAVSVSDIEQTYLLDPRGGAERVRRRLVRDADGERLQLTHTRKVAVSTGVVEEDEREVDAQEYADLLARTDPARRPVVKTRWVVPHGEHRLEIDRIVAPRALWLLEIELPDSAGLDDEVSLPAWVGQAREVTGDPAYANRMLALPATSP